MNLESRCVGSLWWSVMAVALLILANSGSAGAVQRGGAPPPASAQAAAPIDLTGYWVSVVSEDWRVRMVTPRPGNYESVPMTPEGVRVADAWDPAADEAAGTECKAYGAPAIMRVPGRLNITWQDQNTLRIDTDAGMQTRLFRFGPRAGAGGQRTLQGNSFAEWELASGPQHGSLKVVTTALEAGYLRKNGVPYSEDAVLTEFYDRITAPNGDSWLVVTTEVIDPLYLRTPFITSTHFKQESDDSMWNPTPCAAR